MKARCHGAEEEEFEELIKRALDGGLTKEEKWGDIEEEIEGPKKVQEHGLEDLGIAFWGDLTEAQTEYKAKLAQKLEEVRCRRWWLLTTQP